MEVGDGVGVSQFGLDAVPPGPYSQPSTQLADLVMSFNSS